MLTSEHWQSGFPGRSFEGLRSWYYEQQDVEMLNEHFRFNR